MAVSLILLRLADRATALLLLLALLPLLALLAAVIRVLSGRSPLVAHLRTGQHGVSYWMLKFRTMWTPSPPHNRERGFVERVESNGIPAIKPKSDPRVTSAFAAWCRVHSVDELPQLWHVVTGRMSLVGPRPLTDYEIRTHYVGPAAALLLSVPPGMTGLWQVRGRNNLTYRQRRRLDLFLVRHLGWGMYWRLVAMTLPRLLSGAGAW